VSDSLLEEGPKAGELKETLASAITSKLFARVLAAVSLLFLAAVLWQALYLPHPAQHWVGKHITVPTAQLGLVQGLLQPQPNGEIHLFADGNRPVVVRLPNLQIPLEDLPHFYWNHARGNAKTKGFVRWRVAGVDFERAFVYRSDDLATELDLRSDSRWTGVAERIELVIETDAAIRMGVVKIRSDSVWSRLHLMWDGWFGFRPWRMSDLNFIEAVDATETYYFNLTLHIAVLAAMLIYALERWWHKRTVKLSVIVCVLLAGWVLATVRWNVELVGKTWDSWQRFGGKSLHEKHLAADDHEYYWIVDAMRPLLPPVASKEWHTFKIYHDPSNRYQRGKLVYYTTPHMLAQVEPSTLKPGDLFGVIHTPYHYDEGKQLITLGASAPFAAQRVAQRGAAALFRAK
jgi:hypothetical protein